MASPIPYDIRIKIIERRQSGKTFQQIAEEFGYSDRGIKKIWKRFQDHGQTGLKTSYAKSGRPSLCDQSLWNLIDQVRHGDQGAPYIRSVLLERFPDRVIPHERTIQRWLKARGLNRPRGKVRQNKSCRAKQVHEVWQIDGKEQIALQTGEQVSWLNIADEASGSELKAKVSPLSNHGTVK